MALLQVVHAPFLFVEPSLSHWPTVQVGWSAQLPLDVADWPVRYWPCGHSEVCELQSRSDDVVGPAFSYSVSVHVVTGLHVVPSLAEE